MVGEQADLGATPFATSVFCPVLSTHDNSIDDATNGSHHIIIRSGKKSLELKASRIIGHEDVHQRSKNSILDSHHQHHSMVSNLHMWNGQRHCSRISQSPTIKTSSRFSKRSQVTRTSSQRRFSLKVSCQSSKIRSRTRKQKKRSSGRCQWSCRSRSSRRNSSRDAPPNRWLHPNARNMNPNMGPVLVAIDSQPLAHSRSHQHIC